MSVKLSQLVGLGINPQIITKFALVHGRQPSEEERFADWLAVDPLVEGGFEWLMVVDRRISIEMAERAAMRSAAYMQVAEAMTMASAKVDLWLIRLNRFYMEGALPECRSNTSNVGAGRLAGHVLGYTRRITHLMGGTHGKTEASVQGADFAELIEKEWTSLPPVARTSYERNVEFCRRVSARASKLAVETEATARMLESRDGWRAMIEVRGGADTARDMFFELSVRQPTERLCRHWTEAGMVERAVEGAIKVSREAGLIQAIASGKLSSLPYDTEPGLAEWWRKNAALRAEAEKAERARQEADWKESQ